MKRIGITLFLGIVLILVFVIVLGGGFGNRTENDTFNDGGPLLFAHRGMLNYYAENSLEAFIYCEEVGFSAIETDISFTKDNKLIVFHDNSGKRLLGIDANISELNWEEIRGMHLLYNGNMTNNKVLSLEELLDTINASNILYLDIKDVNNSIADSLLVLMAKYNHLNNILIADGNILFLSYLKYKNPEIKVVLEGFNKGKEWLYYIIPKKFKPDYYSSFLSEVDNSHMSFFQKNRITKRKIVYGINKNNLSKVHELGIQNIIFDYDTTMGTVQKIEQYIKLKD